MTAVTIHTGLYPQSVCVAKDVKLNPNPNSKDMKTALTVGENRPNPQPSTITETPNYVPSTRNFEP
jgi:hypothetical protein